MTGDSNEPRDGLRLIEVALPVRESSDASHLKIDLPSPYGSLGCATCAAHFSGWIIKSPWQVGNRP